MSYRVTWRDWSLLVLAILLMVLGLWKGVELSILLVDWLFI